MRTSICFLYLILFLGVALSQSSSDQETLDVQTYTLTLEPDLEKAYLSGTVTIQFRLDPSVNSIRLDAGKLQIDGVEGEHVIKHRKQEKSLYINLADRADLDNTITIHYHGTPKRGLLFQSGQAYTVYFTSHWMVCHDVPSDRASLDITLIIPKEKTCVASGEFVNREETDDKVIFHWQQCYESPPYTYGFAIGDFQTFSERSGNTQLEYYARDSDQEVMQKIFRETGNILQFFEEKSGIPYIQDSYSQVLIGGHYQEMSGFAVLNASYPAAILKDSSEIHLISHELAHQWWGNMITCKDFRHFWLNEAFATYMSTAFSEHGFGQGKYEADIAIYKSIYDDLVKRGKNKPLLFPHWNNPSRDDRNIVYYKGAYVLHLLRLEMGDEAFWKGIKSYSQTYFGKSVETIDFQRAMEAAYGQKLDQFFQKWVYDYGID